MAEDQALQVQDTEKREVAESSAERTRDRLAFVPRADIYETEEAIVVITDMPGVDENSVDITLEDNVLTISGYVEPLQPQGHTFTLSDRIERDGIEATVKDGVLRLHLPKVTEARKRKIAIRAG
jgi:HSP20 family protein